MGENMPFYSNTKQQLTPQIISSNFVLNIISKNPSLTEMH
jgi:hypothetical protein